MPKMIGKPDKFQTSVPDAVQQKPPEKIRVLAPPTFEKLIIAVHRKKIAAEKRHVTSEHITFLMVTVGHIVAQPSHA